MPDITPEDLLFLHHQIEKSETEQKRLENVLSERSKALSRYRSSKLTLKALCSILGLTVLILFAYLLSGNKMPKDREQVSYSSFHTEMNSLRAELNSLKKEKNTADELKELYLFRKLIREDTVYSVQVQSFTDQKVATISEKYTNTLSYQDTSYYKLSLGIFESLPEAQEFRKLLLESGVIDKHIFVISYKAGKRLKIEDPF